MADLDIRKDRETGEIVFSGRVTLEDMNSLRLTRFEMELLREPLGNAADVLLALETVFRRLQSNAAPTTEGGDD